MSRSTFSRPSLASRVFAVCSSVDVCPEKDGKRALNCTHEEVALTDREHMVGKELSCYCGGPDSTSEYICKQQPGTNWQIKISSSDASGRFNLTVIERAGIPSQVTHSLLNLIHRCDGCLQDYHPSCHGHDKQHCPTQQRYQLDLVWVVVAIQRRFLDTLLLKCGRVT